METSDHSKQGLNVDDFGDGSLKLLQGLSNGVELISLLISLGSQRTGGWHRRQPIFCMLFQASMALWRSMRLRA